MTKINFILSLNEKLSGLEKKDVEERLSFYSEMIEDRIEDGLSEEEAVLAVGDVNEIAEQIKAELLPENQKPKKQKRRLKPIEKVLLIAGSPIWASILLAVGAVVVSLYVSLWAIIISLWAVFASLFACAVCGVLVGIVYLFGKTSPSGFALIAAGLICAGLAILFFFVCNLLTKGTISLTKKCFTKREGTK